MQFYKTNLWVFTIAYHRLNIELNPSSYSLDLSYPNRKRLEVSKNVKYIAVTSRASKLQVFKIRPGQDSIPGHPRESLNIGKLTHAGGPGSNPGQAEL